MPNEEQFSQDMRKLALEYIVFDLAAKFYHLVQAPVEQVKIAHEKFVESASLMPIPGLNAVQSDMASDIFATELRNLLSEIEKMLEVRLKQ